MSAAEFSRQIGVPANRATQILNDRRSITGDTALRLAHFFGTSAVFWLNLQSLYEIYRIFNHDDLLLQSCSTVSFPIRNNRPGSSPLLSHSIAPPPRWPPLSLPSPTRMRLPRAAEPQLQSGRGASEGEER
jgi:addiction module HigA family antidote